MRGLNFLQGIAKQSAHDGIGTKCVRMRCISIGNRLRRKASVPIGETAQQPILINPGLVRINKAQRAVIYARIHQLAESSRRARRSSARKNIDGVDAAGPFRQEVFRPVIVDPELVWIESLQRFKSDSQQFLVLSATRPCAKR